ncbi:hypothetical protein ACFU9X_46910 [Streptomyces atratus]|uniref:hypothetical protein n=1 Tax=Streptomyces atratus TaxID=1893 RepID=UPI00364D7B29
MSFERLHCGFGEIVGAHACGLQLPKQRKCLSPHGLLDQREMAHLRSAECAVQTFDLPVDGVLAAGLLQHGPKLGPAELGCLAWGGRRGQESPGYGVIDPLEASP